MTLVCSGITHEMRKGGFPLNEPLEKRSIELASALGNHLSKTDGVFVAPSLRARETAQLLGLRATVIDSLRG
ncbi:hypothetical protein [Mesorhizobium sp. M0778]|uniref:hypothetical protein n=1 Tax=Mesorhizobium sp. M0778 TaxID=2956999 RepID=UPI00333D8337